MVVLTIIIGQSKRGGVNSKAICKSAKVWSMLANIALANWYSLDRGSCNIICVWICSWIWWSPEACASRTVHTPWPSEAAPLSASASYFQSYPSSVCILWSCARSDAWTARAAPQVRLGSASAYLFCGFLVCFPLWGQLCPSTLLGRIPSTNFRGAFGLI